MPYSTDRSQFSGINLMANRINWHGGQPQQDRMIRDKRWTLDHATKYSYQAAKIKHTDYVDQEQAPALINPDKTKQNYDDKILSVGYEYRYKPGDIFDWLNTGTKWIIYLQDLTELAYFRAEIRRCNYTVSWIGEDNETFTQYLAVRGPVETKINFIQKNGISVDEPNHSLDILMTKTPEALKYFRRYAKFYLKGIAEGDKNTCWRVEATDSISMPGVLQIVAVEYYANETKDDLDQGLVNGLVIDPIDPNEDSDLDNMIKGDTFIKPRIEYTYYYRGKNAVQWKIIGKKVPVKIKTEGRKCTLIWDSGYHGQFVLKCGDSEKTIVVESLF